MIYVTSDLHGLKPETLQELLANADFNENDFLYILGDVIDRQNDGGVEMLRWIVDRENVEMLLGNHEAMLLSCDFVFLEITEDNLCKIGEEKTAILTNYLLNGGGVTLNAFKQLMDKSPETVEKIIAYLRSLPLYKRLNVGGREFLLCHSGIDNFCKDKPLSDYEAHDFLWAWPEVYDEYYDDIITVFGHTPTRTLDPEFKGKIFKTRTWIDVDVGVPYGHAPALLRLDDFKEFYL